MYSLNRRLFGLFVCLFLAWGTNTFAQGEPNRSTPYDLKDKFWVKSDGLYGLIDLKWRYVIPPTYTTVGRAFRRGNWNVFFF